MIGINRDARYVMTGQDAGPLLSLLGAVMAWLAEALKILRIEEQNLIAFVRFDVVDRVGGLDRT